MATFKSSLTLGTLIAIASAGVLGGYFAHLLGQRAAPTRKLDSVDATVPQDTSDKMSERLEQYQTTGYPQPKNVLNEDLRTFIQDVVPLDTLEGLGYVVTFVSFPARSKTWPDNWNIKFRTRQRRSMELVISLNPVRPATAKEAYARGVDMGLPQSATYSPAFDRVGLGHDTLWFAKNSSLNVHVLWEDVYLGSSFSPQLTSVVERSMVFEPIADELKSQLVSVLRLTLSGLIGSRLKIDASDPTHATLPCRAGELSYTRITGNKDVDSLKMGADNEPTSFSYGGKTFSGKLASEELMVNDEKIKLKAVILRRGADWFVPSDGLK